MSTALAVLASLGGVASIGAATYAIVRAVIRQVHATEDNTKALDRLTAKVDTLDNKVDSHGERIARLEGLR